MTTLAEAAPQAVAETLIGTNFIVGHGPRRPFG
jgi:hypothetical protein